jgi:hypothetical protein
MAQASHDFVAIIYTLGTGRVYRQDNHSFDFRIAGVEAYELQLGSCRGQCHQKRTPLSKKKIRWVFRRELRLKYRRE